MADFNQISPFKSLESTLHKIIEITCMCYYIWNVKKKPLPKGVNINWGQPVSWNVPLNTELGESYLDLSLLWYLTKRVKITVLTIYHWSDPILPMPASMSTCWTWLWMWWSLQWTFRTPQSEAVSCLYRLLIARNTFVLFSKGFKRDNNCVMTVSSSFFSRTFWMKDIIMLTNFRKHGVITDWSPITDCTGCPNKMLTPFDR